MGKTSEGGDNNNNNDDNDDKEETPLVERVAVAKAVVRNLGDKGEAGAGLEVGPSGNR